MKKGNRPTTINHLLDVEHQSGDSSSKTWKVVIYVALLVLPFFPLLFIIGYIPLKLIAVVYIFYAIRLTMIIPGEEGKRMRHFKQKLYDVYSSVEHMIQYTLEDDGCMRYFNGEVSYILKATVGENTNNLAMTAMVKSLIDKLSKEYSVDIRVYNDNGSYDLSRRYEGVKLFADEAVAESFISLIDHNRDLISDNSTMTEVIFVVSGRATYRDDLLAMLTKMTRGTTSKAYKTLRILNKEEVKRVTNRDADTYIDFDNIMRKKYATGIYHGSKVVGYDVEEEEVQVFTREERGFIPNE